MQKIMQDEDAVRRRVAAWCEARGISEGEQAELWALIRGKPALAKDEPTQ